MGDIISILRHSKVVIDQSVRDKIIAENESTVDKVAVPKVTSTVRRVLPEHEGKYKVSLPKGSTKKTREILAKHSAMQSDKMDKKSIFDRLNPKDVDMADSTSSEPKAKISKASSSIFNRLGKLEKTSVAIRTHSRKPLPARVVMDTDSSSDLSDDNKMELDEIFNKQVKFSPKVEVRVYDERPKKVASRAKPSNVSVGVKSRLEPTSSLLAIRKPTKMKSPKPSPPAAVRFSKMKSDTMLSSQNVTVHSRLDIKHRKTNPTPNSSVFNRLGKNE